MARLLARGGPFQAPYQREFMGASRRRLSGQDVLARIETAINRKAVGPFPSTHGRSRQTVGDSEILVSPISVEDRKA